jgi:transposase
MRVENEEVEKVTAILDDIIKEYKEEHPKKKRDWRTYEQRLAERLKTAFRELKPLVSEAVSSIQVVKGEFRGSKSVLNLEQKVLVLLLKRLFDKSNRNMSAMLVVFSWLTSVDVSYKTIERLYSDELVVLALHNLHCLILKKKGVNYVDCSGDSTGYALTVKKHYASDVQKFKEKVKENGKGVKSYIHSFTLMDLYTRMYIGCGASFKSEKEAFLNGMSMVKETGVKLGSVRLDRYYSGQKCVKFFENNFGQVRMYLIPRKGSTIRGSWEWKRMLYRFVQYTKQYLEEYYRRNQSESGISEDKRRLGWKLGQKKTERVDTANLLTTLWHNLYWLD